MLVACFLENLYAIIKNCFVIVRSETLIHYRCRVLNVGYIGACLLDCVSAHCLRMVKYRHHSAFLLAACGFVDLLLLPCLSFYVTWALLCCRFDLTVWYLKLDQLVRSFLCSGSLCAFNVWLCACRWLRKILYFGYSIAMQDFSFSQIFRKLSSARVDHLHCQVLIGNDEYWMGFSSWNFEPCTAKLAVIAVVICDFCSLNGCQASHRFFFTCTGENRKSGVFIVFVLAF